MTWHFIKYTPTEAQASGNWEGYRLESNFKFSPVCTCGAEKASAPYPPAGHSDWCDINNPPPDTEELPF